MPTSSRPSNYFALPPLYALIIGINEYASNEYKNLQGAVKDADEFNAYLTSRLGVPSQNIINLRDSEATRANILNSFTGLGNLTSIGAAARRDTGAIIFFAGHGTRGEKPKEWEDWITVGDFYEALCPADIGTPELRDSKCEQIPPIPDRTVAALLNRLSETKGNNITLILDCCHSASATRGAEDDIEPEIQGYSPRYIPNPPPISPNYDHEITSNWIRGVGSTKGFSGKNMSSHVLLAACGREQKAHEDPRKPSGVFTYALLKVLKEANVEDLTYTSLMHRLNMPKWQNAHCEGTEINRRLFNHIIEGGNPRFILGTKQGDKLTMDAGIMQGVTVGCIVSAHKTNLLSITQQPNPPLGNLIVKTVGDTSSTLEQPPSSSTLPLSRTFYCGVIQRPSESLVISSPDIKWLETVYTDDFRKSHSISIVPDGMAADLMLIRKGNKVYVDHRFPLAAEHIGVRSPFTIFSDDTWMLREVVRCTINFRFHLLRNNMTSLGSEPHSAINVRMEMKELEMAYNKDYGFVGQPNGRDIFERDPAIVVVEREKRYGMILKNLTDLRLYPHLFYFDPSELSITPWYLPPTGAGTSISTNKVDVILRPNSEFSIGYGEGGVDPWEFMLREGETKDCGFFKLFVTTTPASLGSIAQECPYYTSASRMGQIPIPSNTEQRTEVWDSIVKTVLQVEVGTS